MSHAEQKAFYDKHFPVISSKCARMLGDAEAAADVAQETFVRLIQSPVAHEGPAVRARWIYVTATRLAIDLVRRRGLGIEVRGDSFDAPAGRAAEAEGRTVARQLLERVGDRLSAEELEILVMSRCDRMTQEEIAEVLAVSSRQVRRVLGRVERRLATLREGLV